MAHFAKISNDNEVLKVLYIENDKILNKDGVEDELVGQQYLETHNNWPATMWIKTSYNTWCNTHNSGDDSKAFRGNYASIGFIWDEVNQIFWPPKPYASWVKNNTLAIWKSPLGDCPTLTTEQESQNTAGTHKWVYIWSENNYQADNTTGWILTNDS
jgi:hypothetical protein